LAKQFAALEPKHAEFIAAQRIFFTASAAEEGRVNVSPKGMDSLRVLSPNRVCYMDLTGSGNETAAHNRADGRLTIMFCAFENLPLILRLYGQSTVLKRGSSAYERVLSEHFDGKEILGARQIVVLDFDLVQTSCGYGVPLFDYREDRDTLVRWAEVKETKEGLDAYRRLKNRTSIDGFPTGLFEDEAEPAE
jgi:predicted pyridoxine 5'-phosphate oxidase superfamily flavin-nucleotide-binding protein